jgi:hypothetical protein
MLRALLRGSVTERLAAPVCAQLRAVGGQDVDETLGKTIANVQAERYIATLQGLTAAVNSAAASGTDLLRSVELWYEGRDSSALAADVMTTIEAQMEVCHA